jgi:hypothetical protein
MKLVALGAILLAVLAGVATAKPPKEAVRGTFSKSPGAARGVAIRVQGHLRCSKASARWSALTWFQGPHYVLGYVSGARWILRQRQLFRAVLFSLGAVAILLVASSAAAQSASRETVSLRSGDYVVFRGTSLQCLAFGPVALIKGKTGIFCFKGPPRQHKAGTYWAWLSPARISIAASEDSEFTAITSATTIRRTVPLSLNASVRLVGTKLGCFFQLSRVVDPGQKVVVCSALDARGPVPGKYGFVLSERIVASVTFGADRKVRSVDYRQNQPK